MVMVFLKLWPRITKAKYLSLDYGAVSKRSKKLDKFFHVYEKIGCHANSNYFFQFLNQDFCNDLLVGGCEGFIYVNRFLHIISVFTIQI